MRQGICISIPADDSPREGSPGLLSNSHRPSPRHQSARVLPASPTTKCCRGKGESPTQPQQPRAALWHLFRGYEKVQPWEAFALKTVQVKMLST